jgi:hypothetical protein
LRRAFPLDVLMVTSSTLVVFSNGKCLACSGFSCGKTVCFGSLEFIADYFGGLSLSPRGSNSDATLMCPTHGEPPSPLRAMIEDSTEEFHMDSSREEGFAHPPSPRRHNTGDPPTPVTTAPWLENVPSTQAMTMVPPRVLKPWPSVSLHFER